MEGKSDDGCRVEKPKSPKSEREGAWQVAVAVCDLEQ